ncbi:hypothetical protein N7488_008933 [Penicillium malachiteum]|nr:hypothetical protein N7488_008933 [Penicillium malachiteum]
MASSSSKDYVFTRDYLDNNCINLQRYLTVQLFGYHIHPSIPVQTEDLRIADIGTGTGIWLTDLVSKLPSSTRLDGLDISLDAAHLPEMLPTNLNLRLWDTKDDVPEDLVGVYNVVHVRFFVFVLQHPDLEHVLDDLIKPDIQADAQLTLMKLFQGNDDRLRPTWVPELPDLLTKKGFAEVERDAKECPSHLALAFHESGLLATEVLARNKEGADKDGVNVLKQMLDQATKETRDGSYLAFTRYTFLGRKQ